MIHVQQIPGYRRAGSFATFADWVNKAKSQIAGARALCFDSKMRRCSVGADFMRARDEDAFPVSYWFPEVA